ncbi:hypothetical protein IWW47_001917 [Coemansia sp. RSA 2052]|nr:hypothetical protein IWW47_001917 [Coemansia sp. RSA 2052]
MPEITNITFEDETIKATFDNFLTDENNNHFEFIFVVYGEESTNAPAFFTSAIEADDGNVGILRVIPSQADVPMEKLVAYFGNTSLGLTTIRRLKEELIGDLDGKVEAFQTRFMDRCVDNRVGIRIIKTDEYELDMDSELQ